MHQIIVRLLVIAAICDLGIMLTSDDLVTKQGLTKLQKATVQVSKISWKPISIFEKEAKKFR